MTYGMDYKNIESRMKLRKLELEAYSSIVNAFRAQGNFSKEKKKILNEIRCFLSITIERHQAEIRRAINDEKLSKISANINGEDLLDNWIIEGRRLIPILRRMSPRTAVSSIADTVAKYQIKQNELEQLNIKNSNNKDKSIDDTSKLNNLQSKKRCLNNSELNSTNLKRKLTNDKPKQQKSIPATILSSITIPTISQSNQNKNLIDNCKNLTDKQPKLLIMSTGSMLNTTTNTLTNKTINVNTIHQNSSNGQVIKLNVEDFNRNQHNQLINNQQSSNKTVKSFINQTEIPVSLINNSSTKIFNPKVQNNSPKLMFLPNNSQTKTLTIPISHNVKTLQLPTQNSTILYSTPATNLNCTANQLKIPGITIQNTNQNSQISSAKGLIRHVNAKEMPIKFISTDGLIKKDLNDKTNINDNLNDNRQPTIILTNISKETANSLASGNSSSLCNFINKNQATGNVIKLTTQQLQQANKLSIKQNANQKAISIPAGTSATSFMEILKKSIPISRATNDNKTTISINQLKLPANVTNESITKLIFSNVINNQSTIINNSLKSIPSSSNSPINDKLIKKEELDQKEIKIQKDNESKSDKKIDILKEALNELDKDEIVENVDQQSTISST